MAKLAQQRGPSTDRFERQYGLNDIGYPEGVNTELSPSRIRKEQFRRLINSRFRGTSVVPRGGQAALKGGDAIHDAAACIYPEDFVMGTPKRLWSIGDGCPGQSAGVGFTVSHFDLEQRPVFQRAVWYQNAVDQIAIGSYGGVPHVGVDSDFKRVQLVPVPFGTENISLAGSDQSLPLASFPGFTFNAIMETGGICYLALDDGAGGGKIVSWDGKTVRNDLTAIDTPLALGVWRDQLVVGFGSGSNKIMVRAEGSTSPGTYATVTPGVGTVAAYPGINSITSFKDGLYLIDGVSKVWKYDGTTLAVVHTIAGATELAGLCSAFGFLWYAYTDASNHAVLGRSADGAAFTDGYKDFTTGEEIHAYHARSLAYYKDSLAVGILSTSRSKVYISPGPVTGGTWTGYVPNDLVTGADPSDIRYLVVV